eukprot:1734276-Pyramimonas_sp.AAC.1
MRDPPIDQGPPPPPRTSGAGVGTPARALTARSRSGAARERLPRRAGRACGGARRQKQRALLGGAPFRVGRAALERAPYPLDDGARASPGASRA